MMENLPLITSIFIDMLCVSITRATITETDLLPIR
jgi:hypothetical protein